MEAADHQYKKFVEFCASKSIGKLNIYSHNIALRCFLGRLPLLSSNQGHQQRQFTFISIDIFTNINVSFQHLICAIPLDAYQKNISASNQQKQIMTEAIVQVFFYIFMKLLLVNFLQCRLILVNMANNIQMSTVITSSTAAERFSQYLFRVSICLFSCYFSTFFLQ